MQTSERRLRQAIVDEYRRLCNSGMNAGTAGNVSARLGAAMLITPSSVPADELTAASLAALPLEAEDGRFEGPLAPSSEWRLHRDILSARPDLGAVVHTHAPYATALAMTRRAIPACHYMIALFGGDDVRCAGYAQFGTQALSDLAVAAMRGRKACLLANHGMLAAGADLREAMRLAFELEALARLYWMSLAIGGPVLLGEGEMRDAHMGFATYGKRAANPAAGVTAAGEPRPTRSKRRQ